MKTKDTDMGQQVKGTGVDRQKAREDPGRDLAGGEAHLGRLQATAVY